MLMRQVFQYLQKQKNHQYKEKSRYVHADKNKENISMIVTISIDSTSLPLLFL